MQYGSSFQEAKYASKKQKTQRSGELFLKKQLTAPPVSQTPQPKKSIKYLLAIGRMSRGRG